MVGRPLSCDEHTFKCSRLDFAMICVEVDATHPYVHSFELDTPTEEEPIHVAVEYEWKLVRCQACKLYGHSCADSSRQQTTIANPTTNETMQTQLTTIENPPIKPPLIQTTTTPLLTQTHDQQISKQHTHPGPPTNSNQHLTHPSLPAPDKQPKTLEQATSPTFCTKPMALTKSQRGLHPQPQSIPQKQNPTLRTTDHQR
ncbi:hypothetical protein OIU78_025496, partial [Salix suchowensis]